MESPEYRVFALRYGANPRRRRFENVIFQQSGDCHDASMPMDFFVWAVVGTDRVVLVDTGSGPGTMTARGHDHLRPPLAALADIGVGAADVGDVITTHLHWDHAGAIDDFPHARLHIQRAELAHATGPSMDSPFLRRPYDRPQLTAWLRALYDGRVAFHQGDDEIVPGVSVHHVGGHTPGMQVVRVPTGRGWVVLASDAVHYYENLTAENPFPVLVSTIDYIEALRTVTRLADGPDHIIPGHDPLVLRRFPRVAPGLDGAAALHLEPAAVSA
ncbi:N-acyl homoserine lactonase family protein [Streptomyces violaceusniger]|uniref:N-acyl homoserine lactonase family protein n=1 Tax=Streptomyces violaceusniger TaxID=68280 RepID=A0A4D4LM72_STRVO|nr:N-acyl homoserine lactonase family protein [Streptomyces violaceusniger]